MNVTPMFKHGDERNHRIERKALGDPVTLLDAQTDEPIYHGHLIFSEYTVKEKYCKECGWQTVKGILAELMGCPSCGREW